MCLTLFGRACPQHHNYVVLVARLGCVWRGERSGGERVERACRAPRRAAAHGLPGLAEAVGTRTLYA